MVLRNSQNFDITLEFLQELFNICGPKSQKILTENINKVFWSCSFHYMLRSDDIVKK